MVDREGRCWLRGEVGSFLGRWFCGNVGCGLLVGFVGFGAWMVV